MPPAQAERRRQARKTHMRTTHQFQPDRFQQHAHILLAAWVSLGLLTLVMLPAARGFNEWIGWLPFWLLLAPASSLLVLHRSHIAQWLRARRARQASQRRRHTVRARRPARRASGSTLRTSLAAWLPR
jgi:hypothetical protein